MKKYRIELTGEQMRVLEKCTNIYMRLFMGQTMDLADELAQHYMDGYDADGDKAQNNRIFEKYMVRRDAIRDMLDATMKIAFNTPYHVPEEKSEDCMIAECIWDAIRFARGTSRWDKPFQIGSEPTPKIEVIEDD